MCRAGIMGQGRHSHHWEDRKQWPRETEREGVGKRKRVLEQEFEEGEKIRWEGGVFSSSTL